MLKFLLALCFCMMLLANPSQLFAATYIWDNLGSGNWMDTARWSPVGFPNGEGEIAQITNGTSTTQTITLNTSVTVEKFEKTNASHNGTVSLSPASNQTITIDTIGGAQGTIYCRYGTVTVNANIILADPLYLNATTKLNIYGDISGMGDLKTYNPVTSSGRGCFVYGKVNNTGAVWTTSGTVGKTVFNGSLGSNITYLKAESLSTELNAINEFSGTTYINQGTLKLNAAGGNALVSRLIKITGNSSVSSILNWQRSDQIDDGSSISIVMNSQTANAPLNLGTKNETVLLFYRDGAPQPAGTYGSTASTATFQDDTLFNSTDTGILTVITSRPIQGTVFKIQ